MRPSLSSQEDFGELLHSHFDQIPATLTGITHDVTASNTA